jgi:hypothetical protein
MYLGIRIGEGMGAGPVFVTKVLSAAYMVASFALILVVSTATTLRPSLASRRSSGLEVLPLAYSWP